jgi:minor extracellular serine protease Vpr
MNRFIGVMTVALAMTLALAVTGALAGGPATDGAATAGVDTGTALVELKGAPLATAEKTKPAPGKKVDFDSSSVKSYRAQLNNLRNDFKQWLKANAPQAKVTGEFDLALNGVSVELNGTPLSTIQGAPQVASAGYEGLYRPQAASGAGDPDLALISAPAAWGGNGATGGVRPDGTRVRVAVIDTGIDQTHPCFDTPPGYSYPAGFPKGDTRFTTKKVIVARVFNNRTPTFRFTPQGIQEHGTHVAGTVGCNWGLTHNETIVNGTTVTYGVNGVAPGVQLGNYNVFPSANPGPNEIDVTNARSEDILNALEAAYRDDMDVANLSLGGNANGKQDLLTHAIDNLDAAGMVIAVAAGNSGPGHFTVESPGSAAGALTAGASTVGHFIGVPITSGTVTARGAVGEFGQITSNISAPLAVVAARNADDTGVAGLSRACLPNFAANSLAGKIALVSRGICTFSEKIRNAQDAGAVAVIVVNNVAGDPIAMGLGGIANEPTIPAVMVSRVEGTALAAPAQNGVMTTIGSTKQYFQTSNSDIMANFSSQGSTDVDFRVKPDVVAPGVNVLSSIPNRFAGTSSCTVAPCWAFFQGTSMATPHLAGSAAVVMGKHPTWTSAAIRSAIVNTADEGVLKSATTGLCCVADPQIIGSGRENLNKAVGAKVALNPVSVSFNSVPSGSGQARSVSVTVTDLTGSGGAYAVSVTNPGGSGTNPSGVTFTALPSTITLAPGGSATVTVTMSAAKGATAGDHWATLRIGDAAHAALFTLVK